jgi:hypothetical protein
VEVAIGLTKLENEESYKMQISTGILLSPYSEKGG